MKTRGFVVKLFAVAFAFAPQLLKTATAASAEPDDQQGKYAAKLVSPQAGDVLFPGQKVRIVWEELLPKLAVDPSWCEAEIWLSLDGGQSFPFLVTPIHFDPNPTRTVSFDWTVGNTPTTAAVLDIQHRLRALQSRGRHLDARLVHDPDGRFGLAPHEGHRRDRRAVDRGPRCV